MSRPRKLALGAVAATACLVVLMAVVPALFTTRIEDGVRAGVSRATGLDVTWNAFGLSFLRGFPHPTFSLDGLTAVRPDALGPDTVAVVRSAGLTVDGPSLFGALLGGDQFTVRSVRVEGPSLRLRVDEDGVANWTPATTAEESSEAASAEASEESSSDRQFAVFLRTLEVTDGDLTLDDVSAGLFVAARGLQHSLRGDFSRTSLAAETRLHADTLTVRFAGVPYVGGVALDFDAGIDVDMGEQRFRLIENEVRLNDLLVRLDGAVSREPEGWNTDLTFEAPSTDFGQILSLVPWIYAGDFASLETGGTIALDGTVAGSFGGGSIPSLSMNLSVRDGSFRHADAPFSAQSIRADLSVTNPGGDPDLTVVDLSDFHVEIDGQPFDATATIRTPRSDPEVDATAQGTLDLSALAQTVRLEAGPDFAGVVEADASVRARRSDLDAARYDRVDAAGTLAARDVTVRSEALRQPVDVRNAELRLTPQAAELTALDAQLGSSDLRANGRLDNLLGFALGQEVLRGALTFDSDRLVLDEWRSDDELAAVPVPAMLDMTVDGTVDDVVFGGRSWTGASGRAVVRDRRVSLEGVQLTGLGGRIGIDGHYETLDDAAPAFELGLVLDSLDIAPSAELSTVQALVPVAPYARGEYSSVLSMSGTLGGDMAPILEALNADGTLSTSDVSLDNFPLLVELGETMRLPEFASPTVRAIRSSLSVRDGRLFVDPFETQVGSVPATISGSNGIDRSIDYTLGLSVPRGSFAEGLLTDLAARTGPLGAALAATDPVGVAARATGTVAQPTLGLTLEETTTSVRTAATQATEAAVDERIDEARDRLDAEQAEARRQAQARADSVMAQATRQADAIRAEAASAAATVREEGDRAAEEVLSRATNPLARAAAEPVADRLRREADERATTIEEEADERAAQLLSEAQGRADAILSGVGAGGGKASQRS